MDHKRKAAKWSHGNCRLYFLSWKHFCFFTLYNALCPLLASTTILLWLLIICQILISTFSHALLSPSLALLPHYTASIHLSGWQAISEDAAIKEEPVTVSQALLPPLRVMDLVQSLDNLMSDGQQETTKISLDCRLNPYYTLTFHLWHTFSLLRLNSSWGAIVQFLYLKFIALTWISCMCCHSFLFLYCSSKSTKRSLFTTTVSLDRNDFSSSSTLRRWLRNWQYY